MTFIVLGLVLLGGFAAGGYWLGSRHGAKRERNGWLNIGGETRVRFRENGWPVEMSLHELITLAVSQRVSPKGSPTRFRTIEELTHA